MVREELRDSCAPRGSYFLCWGGRGACHFREDEREPVALGVAGTLMLLKHVEDKNIGGWLMIAVIAIAKSRKRISICGSRPQSMAEWPHSLDHGESGPGNAVNGGKGCG